MRYKVVIIRFDGSIQAGEFAGWWAEDTARKIYKDGWTPENVAGAFLFDHTDEAGWSLDRSWSPELGDRPAPR